MSIRLKLTALAVVLTLVTAGIVGVVSYKILERKLIEAAFQSLVVLRQAQVSALQNELGSIERELEAVAAVPGTSRLFATIDHYYRNYPLDRARLGQRLRWRLSVDDESPDRAPSEAEQVALPAFTNAILAGDGGLRPAASELGFDNI